MSTTPPDTAFPARRLHAGAPRARVPALRGALLALALCNAFAAWAQTPAAPAATAASAAASAQRSAAEATRHGADVAQRAAQAQREAAPKPFGAEDRSFIAKAAAAGAFEVEAGRIGERRAVDPAVRSYAQMLVQQHTESREQLARMASARGLSVAGSVPADKQRTLALLRKTGGFDTAFLRTAGIQAHQETIALFETAHGRTQDAALQAWIDAQLPTLREHLASAQQIPQRNAPDKTPQSSSGPPVAPGSSGGGNTGGGSSGNSRSGGGAPPAAPASR